MIQEYMQLREIFTEKSPLERLSNREHEILRMLADGKTNPEIACILNLSVKSVETYRSRMMQKLGIRDIASLVKFAIQHGLTSLHGRLDWGVNRIPLPICQAFDVHVVKLSCQSPPFILL